MLFRSDSAGSRRVPGVALLIAAAVVLAAAALAGPAQARWFGADRPMPEFTSASPKLWVNSPPLTRADLRGKVVLIEIWTSV